MKSEAKRLVGIKAKTWISIIIIAGIVLIIELFIYSRHTLAMTSDVLQSIPHETTISKDIQPTPTEHEQIEGYIREVFGRDQDKAFKLLSCENHFLNPNAVNDNTKWGGIGQDIGVFQINNKWQGVQGKFLFNWKINIEIAKQLFDENHGKFNLWTCSKELGI